MLKREVVPPPTHIYPPDDWRILEARFSTTHLARAETIFALSNGYLGIRGSHEEGRPALSPGTFVNGFHETWPIYHVEEAYGLARTGQTIINVPDATVLELYVDDEPLFLPVARLTHYRRDLDMQVGILTRNLEWSTPAGKHIRVESSRMVSFEHRHLAMITYQVSLVDFPAPVAVVSRVLNRQDSANGDPLQRDKEPDPRLGRVFEHRVLESTAAEMEEGRFLLGYRAANSGMILGIGVDHVIECDAEVRVEGEVDPDSSELVVAFDGRPGDTLRITKYVAYQTTRTVDTAALLPRCTRTLDRVRRAGADALIDSQKEQLGRFWERADIEVQPAEGWPRLQQTVRWNLFQLAQASWRAEGAGIPAKGLTGQAYEGHYFWDTEVYVLPFLAYTQPRIARNLLRFRYSMLDRARTRARELSMNGALFPWRTITGEEASANFQAGTAQYHINADVAWAIRKYVDVRDDLDFLVQVGAEMLVETARMWEDLGFYGESGSFHFHSVTGPDEYTTVVNDNAYTNLMARLNMNTAVTALRRLEKERPDDYEALVHDTGLRPEEMEAWEKAARQVHVPFDERRGIHPQDSTFLERERWDLEATDRSKFPLLLHFHPLVIYRYQVIKQADVVLAMFLLGNEFDLEQKRRNFDYYDPLTTGDSSLSASVQSIVAAEIGNEEKALEYFEYALMMDLADIAGNVSDGVHVASTGGAWMALTHGFGGLRDFDGELRFDPRLPSTWDSLRIPLRFRNRQLRLTLTHKEETLELLEGEPLEVRYRGEAHLLEVGSPLRYRPPS